MQAAVIETPGQPPKVVDRERPQPRANQVTISVTAAPITPLDLLCASGTSYFGVPETPYVPGVQGVGVVAGGTASIAAGRPVWFATQAGMRPGDGSMCAAISRRRARRRTSAAGRGPRARRCAGVVRGCRVDGTDVARRARRRGAGSGSRRWWSRRAGRGAARSRGGRASSRGRCAVRGCPGTGDAGGPRCAGPARRLRRRRRARRRDPSGSATDHSTS